LLFRIIFESNLTFRINVPDDKSDTSMFLKSEFLCLINLPVKSKISIRFICSVLSTFKIDFAGLG
jgi:hypothetical protein